MGLYGPLVDVWVRRAGVRGADADDVRQEVFAAAADGLAHFRRDRPGDTFRGWLRGITRYKLLDLFRHRRATPAAAGGTDAFRRFEQLPDLEAATTDEEPADLTALYHRALELVRGEFEPSTWRAFWRVAVDGLTAPEAAGELGLSAPAVRMAKSRVLRRLREEIGDLIE